MRTTSELYEKVVMNVVTDEGREQIESIAKRFVFIEKLYDVTEMQDFLKIKDLKKYA